MVTGNSANLLTIIIGYGSDSYSGWLKTGGNRANAYSYRFYIYVGQQQSVLCVATIAQFAQVIIFRYIGIVIGAAVAAPNMIASNINTAIVANTHSLSIFVISRLFII